MVVRIVDMQVGSVLSGKLKTALCCLSEYDMWYVACLLIVLKVIINEKFLGNANTTDALKNWFTLFMMDEFHIFEYPYCVSD